jgi:MFS transporter, DHA2 family, multidrug resistance protein
VAHWRWLFGINLPIGVIAIVVAGFALPESERAGRRLNVASAALHVGTFGLLIGGLQALAHHAATSVALAQIAAGCVLAIALARHELQRPAPLIPFDLLRGRLFSLSLATSVCSFAAQTAALVCLPFAIQRLGHSPAETGLLMTPWPVAVAFAAPVAGRLADRYPAGILGGAGLAALASGLALLAAFPAGGGVANFVWRMALCGLGFGFFQSPNNRTLLTSAPRARSGAAGGMLATARLFGQTLGAAAVAVLFSALPRDAPTVALSAAALMSLAAATLSLARLGPRPSLAE